MASRYKHPHIDISDRYTRRDFSAPRMSMGENAPPRTREEHGVRLRERLQSAFREFDSAYPQDPGLEDVGGIRGAFLEVELLRGTPIEKIERKSKGVTPTATRLRSDEVRMVGLFVPDTARDLLDQFLSDYATGSLTAIGKPQRKDFLEPIEDIRAARFRTFYTDTDDKLPEDPTEPVWWEVWCARQSEAQLDALVERAGGRSAENDRRLYFPEAVIVPVLASQETIEIILFARFTITEVRRASDTPVVFLEIDRDEQLGWVEDLAGRVKWPGEDVPAVCLLDTGVNRAHYLIEPALAEQDMETVKGDWGVADSPEGHGTSMSGVALYGDLAILLQSGEEFILTHRLESVKILPPAGFPPTEERFYGAVTQSAIVLPEIRRAKRPRVYCMAVSNESVSGDQPSGWSAAIDQIASGSMIGDSERKRRLIILSTGNAPSHIERRRMKNPDEYPVEDPGQAWNALTVGGYTDKAEIHDQGMEDYEPYSKPGDLSPHTRTSTEWSGKTPFKPDIVMEAGNRAVSPSGRDILDAESLAVLSTGFDTGQQPLVPFRATSAAAAAAARMAARLMAAHPEYWPETIRALIVHGAEWTEPMKAEFHKAVSMAERAALIRRYGYGVPTFERANASANDHLALVSQAEIQPFANEKKAFKDSHFYELPWPRDTIEAIGDKTVRLKITLSYFIDPNPGFSSGIDPYRYQSFGLRFDLRRRNESRIGFAKRVNARERDSDEQTKTVNDTDDWFFGSNSMSSGSLHCDVWTGSAAKLLTRDTICVRPVGGWWRNRARKEIRSQKTRYSLIVSLKTEDTDINLYTPIRILVESKTPIKTFLG